MKSYLDSSFLFSMYVKDVNSPAALKYLAQHKDTLFLSALTELEFYNAAERRLGQGQLIRTEVIQAYAAFEADIANQVLRVLDDEPSIWLETRRLILKYAAATSCRTADIVHVAAASIMQADKILTFDLRQKELARRIKLGTN